MASRKALLIAAAAAMGVVIVGALLPATASAVVYKVGDDRGWAPGVNYDAWAHGKTFKVGDTLEFVYSTESPNPNHNVWWVNEKSYQECNLYGTPKKMSTDSGDDRVSLTGAGLLLFISSPGNDCKSGMKLRINVSDVIRWIAAHLAVTSRTLLQHSLLSLIIYAHLEA